MTKRILALCLALVMLVGLLAGCSGNKTEQAADHTTNNKQQADDTSVPSAKYAYQAQYLDLPEEVDWVNASCVQGEMLYFAASVKEGQQSSVDEQTGETYYYDNYVEKLFRMDLNTGECTQLENYDEQPIGSDGEQAAGVTIVQTGDHAYTTLPGTGNTQAMAAGADGTLWIYRSVNATATDAEDGEVTNVEELIQLDSHGTLLRTIPMAQEQSNSDSSDGSYGSYGGYVGNIYSDTAGNVYTYDYSDIKVYGTDGSLLMTLDTSSMNGGNICKYSDDQIGMVVSDSTSSDSSMAFRPIDVAAKTWGEDIPLCGSAWSIYPGDDVYEYYYISSGNIFGIRKDNGEAEKVVDWMSCDINSNDLSSDRYAFLADGRVVAMSSSYSSTGSTQQVIVLSRVDASTIQQKTELTLACFYLDYNLRAKIVEFNKKSSEYRIVVKDYSEYTGSDSTSAETSPGLTKLNTEIISGNIPDILVTEQLPIRQYVAKGIIEDMWSFVDADPEFTRESFMQKPLEAMQIDGHLYEMPTSFQITTAIGLGKVVGGYDTWTLADVNDALSRLPEGATVFNKSYTRNEMLQYCVAMNADSFMNWQTGECSFDSDEFRALLEFVNPFPDSYDWQSDDDGYESDYSRLKSGKQLLYPTGIYGFDDVYYTFAALNNDVRFVGFPREDGSNGNCFVGDTSLAITTSCKDKTAAWSFVRSLLSEEYQEGLWGFPIMKEAFEKKAAEAMTQEYETDANGNQVLDENGNPIPISTGAMSYGDEEPIELYAMTQEQYDAILKLIDDTTSYLNYDQNVLSIISDEASAYFSGSKSVEEVSKLIQSRVSLYIQEQK